jgi:hypothetical protein
VRSLLASLTLLVVATAVPVATAQKIQLSVDVSMPGSKIDRNLFEHIKIHGTTLEGNLEGNAVDRDVFVFLPPSYAQDSLDAIQSFTPCTVTPSAPSNGRMKSMSPRLSKAPRSTADNKIATVQTMQNESRVDLVD